jgi:apolipoprotein N-acyltransferase
VSLITPVNPSATTLTSGKRGGALIFFAGALLPLSLAPFDYRWFAPLPLIACLLLLQHQPLSQCRLRSFLFGLGYFGTGASWVYVSIHDYGYTSMPLAACLTLAWVAGLALVFALPLWAWSHWLQRKPLGVLLGFPAVWVLNEWMRSWLLTGFPWLYIGYSQTNTVLGAWAPVSGIYGISFLLALIAASVVFAARHRRYAALPIAIMGCAFISAYLLEKQQWTTATGTQQAVALIQGNVAQQQKWQPEQRQAIRNLYRDMSAPFWQKNQLVIWPEAAIPELYTPSHPFFAAMRQEIAQRGGGLITGVPSLHHDGNAADGRDNRIFYNSLLGLGEAQGFYHKRRLVPFGEYVPLQSWLEGLLDFFKLPISDFRTGPDQQDNLTTGLLRVASSICYEITYPELVASQASDADILLTVSNDTWFGASIGPHQHLQMAQMRARENARNMLRATSNGISAFIDYRGELVSRSAQFQPAVLQGNIEGRRGVTPYQRTGNWPVLILCFLGLLLAYRDKSAH